ncbi:tRNA 5-methoxyuridine(34)/uridine 5-oxyacetic acid(34) synthase CmoB [Shewanella chilikensis]|uniref:tRNA U34 carboxymethyltransferase n=1 Tax=Shewanella chilikensis TaxID=558541 RepID=A0A6G7LSJ9_9GAMM|nr:MULTISPECIES: tRNA 5-methoxyuridine(34)/uridine 5-oxyacetic acid(34) synthase CmoB [Shewanella]MBZ4680269.1 tRNA 5-methoxyuridine(34)/uridine 5-oxyacetic acid(34) synthase CmoB [Shewanella sp.]MCE9850754.1 tRNA 5-methoxyuridine(34)/uridine 5-oxyacetic acid(34) synthase CmoB [Shewanella chilikensis]MCL1164188.1 tRNA 5-methoxyuridine(34)/uridine 5-oxyacetic acid(34) synthase CmoB [Shewanella chilikensis]QIJ04615.1 tRNA 5-methoxyuridine(34)/uridine 5-oxyacetic acid(34) synthase CmoB [Shewanella
MISFSNFYQQIADSNLQHWLETLPAKLGDWQREHKHGALPKWEKVLAKLNYPAPDRLDFKDSVTIGSGEQLATGQREKLENLLQLLHPWRKGPFHIHGIHIDTEWRSDWKWERVAPHISPLAGRTVLDVGCGSGYHMWRMYGEGAKMVVGVDPSSLFLCQFEAVKRLAGGTPPVHLLPLGIEELPPLDAFDTVFSMGVLYHRRSPIDHLLQLRDQLRTGGELILETLVIEGDENAVLLPRDRYGKMNNVWFIPSVAALQLWLEKCDFREVRCVDVDVTSLAEQRSTPWMRNESLVDYLDPTDINLTVEGYPAPKRATFIAIK